MAKPTKLDILRMEAHAEADIQAIRGFEISLGKTQKEATAIAVKTVRVKYPLIANSPIFKIAE